MHRARKEKRAFYFKQDRQAPEARDEVSPARERWASCFGMRAPNPNVRKTGARRGPRPEARNLVSHLFSECDAIVFSTKERRKIIPMQMKERLWAHTAGICQHQGVFIHAIGGMEDHIRLLLQFPATVAIADAINKIKTNSSGWMSRQTGRFAWQLVYGGFGVSKSNIAAVVRYIQNQERHHRKMMFEEEFIALLKKHGIEYDPRYVFG